MDRPDIAHAMARLRAAAPLVHNITNYVVMNSTANVLLAVGASPAMVHAAEEVEDFAALARALVVNIGTLSPSWLAAMEAAARAAGGAAGPGGRAPPGGGAA
ncbi:MAG: hydroxyethylthiazole kinase, partial [Rhodospirillaceae bacterium]|nr:hydroxyethylthiazole kinase [Rhodospirillaceae bacterium]